MSTTTTDAPFALPRLARIGTWKSKKKTTPEAQSEEWYIPYNGPYEAPREPARRKKERDSWGDPVGTDDDDEVLDDGELRKRFGYGAEYDSPTRRSGDHHQEQERGRDRTQSIVSGHTISSGAVDPSRASFATLRRSTVSSGARPPVPSFVNLNAASGGGVGESPAPPAHKDERAVNRMSFASIFGLGPGRKAHTPTTATSSSGVSSHRQPSSSQKRARLNALEEQRSRTESPASRPSYSSSNANPSLRARRSQPLLVDSVATSDEEYWNSYYTTLLPSASRAQPRTRPQETYTPSPPTSASTNASYRPRPAPAATTQAQTRTLSPTHPYAYAFPSPSLPSSSGPQTAPLPGPSTQRHPPPPRLTFTNPLAHEPVSADTANFSLPTSLRAQLNLKSSMSTPNLRLRAAKDKQPDSVPKGKERWLSAETWCDALLFPRPRLRLKGSVPLFSSSSSSKEKQKEPARRIVSPPGTPLGPDGFDLRRGKDVEGGVASRVLAYSRSLVDLRSGGEGGGVLDAAGDVRRRDGSRSREGKGKERSRSRSRTRFGLGFGGEKGKGKERVEVGAEEDWAWDRVAAEREKDTQRERERETETGKEREKEKERGKEREQGATLRPPRPQSWALDDLALPSPVPSLARVLEDGALLQSQRAAWQAQAQSSIGNKAARSVSRARSKSLTAKGRRVAHIPQGNIDFLAARACLGNQDVVSVLSPLPTPLLPPASMGGSGKADRSTGYSDNSNSHGRSGSHGRSNSLVKTLTKSSAKTHSRNHSRSDSWSRSAIKMAKSTVALCGLNGADGSPVLEAAGVAAGLDTVLRREGVDSALRLEGALKRDGTRVIRLADPALIPVDKGVPTSPPRVSPTPSGYSDMRIGIALSTPPPAPAEEREEIRLPAHPYAQGGMYTYSAPVPAAERGADYAGPHRSNAAAAAAAVKVGDIPETAARHKLPPHITLHPYAARDSYVPQGPDKLVPQHRPDSEVPAPAKMWAQLSPGVVREILPADIQYSPYISEHGHGGGAEISPSPEARNSTNITDTVGVAEALAYAIRGAGDRDSGLGTSEEQHGGGGGTFGAVGQPVWLEQQLREEEGRNADAIEEVEEESSPEMVQRMHRLTVQYDASRPSYMQGGRMPSDPSTNHTLGSSPLITPSQPRTTPFGLQPISPSPADTSASSSAQPSPRPLGSPTDLENFKDLFYKPKPTQKRPSEAEISASLARMPAQPSQPWNILTHKRSGSSLTTLARQLSEEFENMAKEQETSASQYSRDSASGSLGRRSLHRRPTDDGLEFVLEEAPRSESPVSTAGYVHAHEPIPIPAFKPSVNIPEDVESSRASTPMEKMVEGEDEDNTAVFRVGMVESISTPSASFADHRISFMGDMSFVPDSHRASEAARTESDARVISGLQPPLTDATRSSYMTTSTMSRMSGLSDFPAPPKVTPKHMSLLSSYFDEAMNESSARGGGSRSSTPPVPTDDHRVLNGEQEAEELLAALSASRPPSRI